MADSEGTALWKRVDVYRFLCNLSTPCSHGPIEALTNRGKALQQANRFDEALSS